MVDGFDIKSIAEGILQHAIYPNKPICKGKYNIPYILIFLPKLINKINRKLFTTKLGYVNYISYLYIIVIHTIG